MFEFQKKIVTNWIQIYFITLVGSYNILFAALVTSSEIWFVFGITAVSGLVRCSVQVLFPLVLVTAAPDRFPAALALHILFSGILMLMADPLIGKIEFYLTIDFLLPIIYQDHGIFVTGPVCRFTDFYCFMAVSSRDGIFLRVEDGSLSYHINNIFTDIIRWVPKNVLSYIHDD